MPQTMKMVRQVAASRTSAPRLGAMMGTVRNTMKVSDITRAICRPEYTSRITERVTTALAADSPCTKRQASSAWKLPARPESNAASTYTPSPPINMGRLPKRSDISPQKSCPHPRPAI